MPARSKLLQPNRGLESFSAQRLLATTLAVGACVVLLTNSIFAFYYDLSQQKMRRQEIENQLVTVGNATTWGVGAWLNERSKQIEEIAQQISAAPDAVAINNTISRPIYEQSFTFVYYGRHKDGFFYSSPDTEALGAEYDPRIRPWYIHAMSHVSTSITEPYQDLATGLQMLSVNRRVVKGTKLLGVVGGDIPVESFMHLLNIAQLTDFGHTFIVNGGGRIIIHPDEAVVGKALDEVYKNVGQNNNHDVHSAIKTRIRDNTLQLVHFVDLRVTSSVNWRLGIAIDKKRAFAGVREFRRSAIIGSVVSTLVLILVLGVVTQRLLVAPLFKARRNADAASAAKSEFLASMSHEIRTPMNGVLGMTQVLLNTELNDKQREFISIIDSSGRALMTVINDILDFSKLETGKLRLTPREFNLRRLTHETVTMMQARAAEKGIEVVLRYAPDLPEGFIADDSRVRQVLGNLIGNAVKFTDAGYVAIDISGACKDDSADIRITVTDTGIGIPAGEISRMFERFEQADGSHTRRFGGTGLGLAISKNIVDLMGGQIGCESTLGIGSRFWVILTLPIAHDVEKMAADDGAMKDFSGVRLLAVDDNAVNRQVVTELMDGWKADTTAVASAEEAMAALEDSIKQQRPFDFILMDYQMPGEDGTALTARIQLEPAFKTIPVIMLSSIDSIVTNPADEALFAATLTKPIQPGALADSMARILNGRPEVRPAAIPPHENKTQIPSEKTSAARDNTPVILLAEDNVVNQMVFRNMTPSEVFKVLVAENGLQAIDLFSKHQPAVVVMDLSMPIMDGFDTTREIRRLEAELGLARTPIIALTAHVLDEDRERCMQAGMDDFLMKPMQQSVLRQTLERWTDRTNAGQARPLDNVA